MSPANEMPTDEDLVKAQRDLAESWDSMFAQQNLASRWTRLCWWLSRKRGGKSVFGKQDLSGKEKP